MTAARRLVRPLLLLFLLSGASGLVYEVVWLRMLIRVFGISVHAVSTIIVAFMGGLALGGLLANRAFRGRSELLRAYAVIEVLIALAAIVSTEAMLGALPPAFRWLAHALGPEGGALAAGRLTLAVLVL